MNYEKIYNILIERAKERDIAGYKERHHIIPRCMGGDNEKSNLVDLTPEEHFLAHQLLVKMYPKNHKLVHAVSIMCVSSEYTIRNNKRFGWIKRKFNESNSGENAHNYGKKFSEETRKKMSNSMKGLKRSEDARKRQSVARTGEGNPFYGKTHSAEFVERVRQMGKTKQEKVLCPHCLRIGGVVSFGRSHFDKCKFKGIPPEQQKHRNVIPEDCKLPNNKVVCPHCNKVGDYNPAMSRYHFDNCKFKGVKNDI